MASNLGYIDRLGAVTRSDVQAHLQEVWAPIGQLINKARMAKDAESKANYARQAKDMYDAAVSQYSTEEIGNHPQVKHFIRILLYSINAVNAVANAAIKAQGKEGEVARLDDIFLTVKPPEENKIPWVPIAIGVGAVTLAMTMG